jgi:hypothetical protein
MKVVFAGPSLHGSKMVTAGIDRRPPARQGDVFAAAMEGARVIGLIDGVYESVASVWHKEILFALSRGVRVFGGASLGALRAVECEAFGMVGVGAIFEAYRCGARVDDGDVALLHGPPELGYSPLSEPLVNVSATLASLSDAGALDEASVLALAHAADALFFKDRTWSAMIDRTGIAASRTKADLLHLVQTASVNAKRADAEAVLEHVMAAPDALAEKPIGWTFFETSGFESMRLKRTKD